MTLMIISALMLSITEILQATRVSRDHIYNIQETQLAGPAIMDLIERDLRGIFTYNRPADMHLRVRDRILGGKAADSIDFVTTTDSLIPEPIRGSLLRSDFNEVSYCCRQRPGAGFDDFFEIFRRQGFGVDEEPFDYANSHYSFLHDRITEFDILVFEEDGVDADPLEEWGAEGDDEHQGLPARVEITLTLELAPRILNERLLHSGPRSATFKRIIRFPEVLRASEEISAVPIVPQIPRPSEAGDPAANPGTGNNNAPGNNAPSLPGR